MRKHLSLVTIMLILSMIFGFTSCKKEGIYKPKEKISKIHYEYSEKYYYGGELTHNYSSSKRLSEKWNWQGKKLMQIEHSDWPYNFSYKGNQLEKIEYGDIIATFTYNKSLYEKIEIKENDKDILIITVDQREGDNITRFFFEIFYESNDFDYMSNKASKVNETAANSRIEPILQIVLPRHFTNFVSKNIDKKRQKSIVSDRYTVEMKYEKNNVVEQKIIDSDGNFETYIFTYDTKKNPYYKSIHTSIDGGDGNTFVQSENNILTTYDKDSPEDIRKYVYEYDGDYPKTRTENYSSGDEWFRSERTYTYYYEYE